jgi:hypothetical protein
MEPELSLAPQGPPSPAASQQFTRFNLRNSMSSVFRGSSVYSQSPRPAGSPNPRLEARFRLSNPVRGVRMMTNNLRSVRSRSSTRSLIDASILPISNVQPLSLPYASEGGTGVPLPSPALTPTPERVLSGARLPDLVPQQDARRSRRQARRPKRRSRIFSKDAFKHRKVRIKARMSIAFGWTLMVALALCTLALPIFPCQKLADSNHRPWTRHLRHRIWASVSHPLHPAHPGPDRRLLPLATLYVHVHAASASW